MLLPAGCGGSKPAAKGKQQSTTAVPRIAPPAPRIEPIEEPPQEAPPPPPPPARNPVGPWLEWQVATAEPVEGKSYLKLVVIPGYDSVLQLASYDSPDHEDFPSLFIRAITLATKLNELVNKKLPAQLYIMIEKDGNMLHNLLTQPLEIIITEIDGKNVRGTFSGEAHDVDSGGNGPISGKFQAIVE